MSSTDECNWKGEKYKKKPLSTVSKQFQLKQFASKIMFWLIHVNYWICVVQNTSFPNGITSSEKLQIILMTVMTVR